MAIDLTGILTWTNYIVKSVRTILYARNLMSIIFSQQILSNMLLLAVTGKKKSNFNSELN